MQQFHRMALIGELLKEKNIILKGADGVTDIENHRDWRQQALNTEFYLISPNKQSHLLRSRRGSENDRDTITGLARSNSAGGMAVASSRSSAEDDNAAPAPPSRHRTGCPTEPRHRALIPLPIPQR